MERNNVIEHFKRVAKANLPRKKRLSRYEQSMSDVKEGRVYEAKDVDDLFKK